MVPSVTCCFFPLFTLQNVNTKWSTNARLFFGDFFLPRRHPMGPGSACGVLRGEHNPPGRARRPRRTLVGCAPSGHPQVQPGPIAFLLAHKKSLWSFVAFGLHPILISCDVKHGKKQQLALGNVNRLVPKNDIKWLYNDYKTPKIDNIIPWSNQNYRYVGDVLASPNLIPAHARVGQW